MNVNNGRRIAVDIPGYKGEAGFSDTQGSASLSFPTTRVAVQIGETVEVDGRRWTVTKTSSSQFIRGFKVIELTAAEGA